MSAILRVTSSAYRPGLLMGAKLVRLGKPRVVALIVFTAVIGMFLATPGLPPPGALLFGTIGIALVASSAAALNCLIEQKLDATMARTRARPLPMGTVTPAQALVFIAMVGGTGLLVLHELTNPLTMWLTLATFLGYAVVYTILLKPRTSQNIVIGGASGAMPPVLGWCAVTGEISSDALLLFLIIFAWTPPHFWALALYRKHEYARAGVPMLPVTHGDRFTRLHVLLYAMLLAAICLLPFASGMSGTIYLISALALNGVFLAYAVGIYVNYSDRLARRAFRYSIVYLSCLFAALLVDHYWRFG
jgi:protoheme IX farnesyltransferase